MSVDTERDLTGLAATHQIQETLVVQRERLWWVAPTRRPFYTHGLVLHDPLRDVDLIPGDDYVVIHLDDTWSTRTQQEMGHFLVILDSRVGSLLEMTAQVLGGDPVEEAPSVEELRGYIDNSTGTPPWGVFIRREIVDPDIAAILALTKRVTFQHVVEETEGIRQALLYGDAEHHQEMMTFAVDTRSRYYQRILELLQAARDAISAHAANKFAHQLTKAQVGLGQYPNYPVAPQIVLEAGASHAHLVTPKGLGVMMEQFSAQPLLQHLQESPGHDLTPAQVGLGDLHDYPMASTTEAQLGKLKTRYMTPKSTLEGLQYQFSSKLYQHEDDADSHDLVPSQIGLGLYENYAVYDPADFDDVVNTDDQYMTPNGLLELIHHHYWDSQLSHVYDENNPHQLTAEQVGLGNVTNLSRNAYDALYVRDGHAHTARTLPFTDSELRDWKDTADWVLDSRISDRIPGTVWSADDDPKTGETILEFPDTVSNRVVQHATVVTAVNRQTGETETKEGTISVQIEQIDPVAASGIESVDIPWRTMIRDIDSVVDLEVPDLPEEAWPMTQVLMTSTDSALSTATQVEVGQYVTRRQNQDDTYSVVLDEARLRFDLFESVDPASPIPVTLFFTYDRPVGNTYRHRYQINNSLFWVECKRLFPEISYENHAVSADLFFLTELPDRLKGPDGVFFRGVGHYPYMRAQATTPSDVGLSKVPNWDEAEFFSRYSAINHTHPLEGWISTSQMQQTYLGKNNYDTLRDSIVSRVWEYVIGSPVRSNALAQVGPYDYRRARAYPNPTSSPVGMAQYRNTTWSVYKGDLSGYSNNTTDTWVKMASGFQTQTIPFIRPNTGTWVIEANHVLWNNTSGGGGFGTQRATLVVSTGAPLNPVAWIYDIYETMLNRGTNIYRGTYNANQPPTWDDPTGVSFWLNHRSYSSKDEMQTDVAERIIDESHLSGSAGGGLNGGDPQPYYRSVAYMDSNHPGWNWGPWEWVENRNTDMSDDVSAAVLGYYNSGAYDNDNEEFRQAVRTVDDPAAVPLKYSISVDRRTTKYNLFN